MQLNKSHDLPVHPNKGIRISANKGNPVGVMKTPEKFIGQKRNTKGN